MCHVAKYAPYVTRPRTALRRPSTVPAGGAEVVVLYPEHVAAATPRPEPHRPHRRLGHWFSVLLTALAAVVVGGSPAFADPPSPTTDFGVDRNTTRHLS
jgi:hypothetical protein